MFPLFTRFFQQRRQTPAQRQLRVEILEDRLAPVASASVVGTALLVTGDNTANAITIRLVQGNASQTEVLDGNNSLGTFDNAALTNIVVNLNGGDDSLKLDDSNGNPVPAGGLAYDGGAGTDALLGPDVANTWAITAANTGTLNTNTTFTNVESLVGGSAADLFKFSPGGSLATALDGGGGSNTLDYSALATRVVVSIAGAAATGVNSALKNSVFNIQSAIGSSASTNLFVGPNADATWNISGPNAGSVVTASTTYTFSAFPNLAGSTGADTFKLTGSARLDGYADGGAGTNTLDYSGYVSRAVIDLANNAATGINNLHGSGISRFRTLVGSTHSNTNLLVGSNADSIWDLTGADSGTLSPTVYGTISFSTFQYLTGGTGADTFKMNPGATVSGAIDGRITGGPNTLDYSSYGVRVTVSLADSAATGIRNASGNGVFDFRNIVGSGVVSSLLFGPQSSNSSHIWNLTGPGAGNIDTGVTFTGFDQLDGGYLATFKFENGTASFRSIKGGTFDYTNYGQSVQITLLRTGSTATAAGTIPTGIAAYGKFIGSAVGSNIIHYDDFSAAWYITNNNAFTLNKSQPGTEQFVGFQNIIGTTGSDVFIFSNGVGLSGSIDGNGGVGMLDYSAWTTPVTVNCSAGTATAVAGGVSGIQSVFGGAAADTLTGSTTGLLLGNGGNDHLIGGSGRYLLVGGAGADTIEGGPDGDLIIAGTTDYDTLPQGKLFNLYSVWANPKDDYATRIDKLRTGTGTGTGNPKLIFGTTVHDDGANNTITGDRTPPLAGALDWFFINTAGHDTITDLQNGEIVN